MIREINENLLLTSSKFMKQKEFWLKILTEDIAETKLMPGGESNNEPGTDSIQTHIPFPDTLSDTVIKLGKQSDLAVYIILLAALKSLIYRIAGTGDVTVMSPVYREFVSGETMGRYVFIRNAINEETTFKELLISGKQSVLGAYEHQDYPCERLVPGENGRVTNVGCALTALHDGGVWNEEQDTLAFVFSRENNRLSGAITGHPSRFDRDFVDRFPGYFTTFLRSAAAALDEKISRIPFLPEEEKTRLLHEFNDTDTDYPGDKTLHELFEEQAARTPGFIAAVGAQNHALTYGELNRRANRLAHLLREKGVGPDTVVGIVMGRSLEMIAGLMGVLKAGGAYLPIDPGSPETRIASILNDCRVHVLLTRGDCIAGFSFIALQDRPPDDEPLVAVTAPRPQVTDFDSLPFPDYSLIDYDAYAEHIGFAMVKHRITLQATRGCPYQCAYCHKIWPKSHVVRSAENIFREVRFYYDLGVRRFTFVDDIFNLDVKNSRRFFETIIENNMHRDIQIFFPGGLRGDILTKDYIDLMIRAGTTGFALALESASPRLQKYIKKNLDIKKLRENIEYICNEYPRIILELQTMHGFPTETEEEAMETLEFIKSLKWVHFPYVHILKIYQDCEMETMALESGISMQSIIRSEKFAWHELPDTLPFKKSFTLKYQAEFLTGYFLSRERLLHVLPYQMKVLTEEEIVKKYNSYLPNEIDTFPGLLEFLDISKEEIQGAQCPDENRFKVPRLNARLNTEHLSHTPHAPAKNALRVLLLDLSQFFSHESRTMYDVYEAPLGLLYLATYLNRELGENVRTRIAKARVDFDNYAGLKTLIRDFEPDVIGIRTLTLYRDFFHKTAGMIRHWGIDVPVIAGGPYASSDYRTVLQDRNVDLAVLGEGEVTFLELLRAVMENHRKLPREDVLKEIPGLAFVPREKRSRQKMMREILMPDVLMEGAGKEETGDPARINTSSHLAYTFFTSGTTGRPKGVLMEHRNAVNTVTWFGRSYALKPGTHVLMMSDYTFDANVNQVFGTLVHGGTVHVISRDLLMDIELLRRYIDRRLIHIVNFVPLFLKELLLHHRRLESLRVVLSGADRLDDDTRDRLLAMGYRLYNQYGPTETSIDALVGECSTGEPVHLGRPIANTKVYVLDKTGGPQLLPPGAAGELYVTGAGVARGYLNNPELTAEKFSRPAPPLAPSPLSPAAPPLYRTGDLVRWLPDGNIEFLGRIDNQVKIRGFRIELGEIENRLSGHPAVKEAAVLAASDETGNNYLCAYVVPGNTDAFTPDTPLSGELKDYLSQSLPDYMIPTYFAQIEKMPVTAAGKLNKRALPVLSARSSAGYAAPRDGNEKKLARLWGEVLGVGIEKIGIDDNFFELGGHSLKATILASKIHKAFNVKIPLREIFNIPTVREFAEYIARSVKDRFASVNPVEKKEYYDLSSAQGRLYVLQQMYIDSITYNVPRIVTVEGPVDKKRIETAFKTLVRRHESLRTSFRMIGEEAKQIVHDDVDFNVGYSKTPPGKADGMVNAFVRPFDLSHAPLLRVEILEIEERKHILMIDMHHIISDGTSMKVFVSDFMSVYEGKTPPPMNIQYKDFSCWQNEMFASEEIKRQEAYWLKQFEGEIPLLNLPTDFPRPAVRDYRGAVVDSRLDSALTRKVKTLAADTKTTLYMVLSAVFSILMSKYSGQEDVVVGSSISGRTHADLHHIIGMFVNMLPIRNRPRGGMTFLGFLEELRENVLGAFENQDYQFEKLVSELDLQGSTGRNPLFDAAFVFQNTASEAPESERTDAGGETVFYPYRRAGRISKFDLLLVTSESGDHIHMILEYSVELFKPSSAEKIIEHYLEVLNRVVENRDIKLKDIDISHNMSAIKTDIDGEDYNEFEF